MPNEDRCLHVVGGQQQYCTRASASKHGGDVFNVAMCDGSVQTIIAAIDGTAYQALATITGREIDSLPQ